MGRHDTIERIRSLRAKASDAASTEAEAESAAAMIARLMTQHDIDEAEIGERSTDAFTATEGTDMDPAGRLHDALRYAVYGIGKLTQTRAIYRGHSSRKDVCFFGLEADVEAALYLAEIVRNSADRAWAHDAITDRSPLARKSFKAAFGHRLSLRMQEMAEQREETTGTALVVSKDGAIQAYVDENVGKIRNTPKRKWTMDKRALEAGDAAGRLAEINPLVRT